MKSLFQLLSSLAVGYVIMWCFLRYSLYLDATQPWEPVAPPTFVEMQRHSGQFHGCATTWKVRVMDVGDPVYSFFGISTLEVSDGSGIPLRVYGDFPLPNAGEEIWLKAEFKQLRNQVFFDQGSGLMQVEIRYNMLSGEGPE